MLHFLHQYFIEVIIDCSSESFCIRHISLDCNISVSNKYPIGINIPADFSHPVFHLTERMDLLNRRRQDGQLPSLNPLLPIIKHGHRFLCLQPLHLIHMHSIQPMQALHQYSWRYLHFQTSKLPLQALNFQHCIC